ncbi:MAG: hypothetical protein ABIZ04_14425 [Opitutus sp.]
MISRRLGPALAWVAVAGLAAMLVLAGYWLLFSTFMEYDDEGYVLLSLQNYSLHGALYDKVYTQYGPFLYILYDGLHRVFGFAFDNTSGRWITLVNWFGTGAACAAIVFRTTRSTVWTAFTLCATFTYLWVMVHEPVHPGGLLSMMVAVATLLGAEFWRLGRVTGFIATTGLVSAALLLTKINVGIFFAGAVIAWLVLNTAQPLRARNLTWVVALGCAILPVVLMASMLSAAWVRLLAFVFATSALGILATCRSVGARIITGRHWAKLVAWCTGGIGAIALISVLRGTSVTGLVDGIILEPLKHPGVYFFPVQWLSGSFMVALSSLGLALAASRSDRWLTEPMLLAIVGVRIIAAICCIASLLELFPVTLAAWGLSFGLPLAWCFAFPLRKDLGAAPVRTWIALVLVFQSLQVYPVAGSQLNWGTFLWIPLLALGLHESAAYLASRTRTSAIISPILSASVVAVVVLFSVSRLARTGWRAYHAHQPLALTGADNLRLSNDVTYPLRIAAENIRIHADVLFSFPGMYSANLWTGIPPPTLANATHWFSLLSASQQQEIISELKGRPKAMMLVQRDVLNYLHRHGFQTRGILHDWLMNNFHKELAFGGYELWTRQDRHIAGYSTARPGPGEPGVLDTLTLTIAGGSAPIARIDLCNLDQPKTPLISFNEENSGLSQAPCTVDGHELQSYQRAEYPLRIAGSTLVKLRFLPIQVSASFDHLLIVLRDSSGGVLGELLIADDPSGPTKISRSRKPAES